MSEELIKFIEEQFEALRRDFSKAFEEARLRHQTAEATSKLNKQQSTL